MKQGITRFFKYARARHATYHEKMAGKPRGQQTKDPIIGGMGEYAPAPRFTNVFRELDKTTVWFREHVRDRLSAKPEVLLATVLFRLLNRIEVGEVIFGQLTVPDRRWKGESRYPTPFDLFLATGDAALLRSHIKQAMPTGPYATGAYIISSPPGYEKLDGILEIVRRFYHEEKSSSERYAVQGWRELASYLLARRNEKDSDGHPHLQAVWEWLKQFDYFGPFHSYEIVTDLRHTALLDRAPDIMTWASPGPGARRGLNRVHGRDKKDHSVSREGLITEMRELLEHSRKQELWPNHSIAGVTQRSKVLQDWPIWEMRDIEHTLCEFDKYERVRLGEGRPRGVYR